MLTLQRQPYGLLAEFTSADALLRAAATAHQAGYRRMDAFSPFPIEGLPAALGLRRTRLPTVVLICGLLGGLTAYGFQYWSSAVDYPLNVGGRPLNSWPAFVPVTFELTVLGAALAAVLGMLGASGLPRPHHPLFEVPSFARATQDRFFLVIESRDGLFQADETRRFLEALSSESVVEVPG